MLAVVLKLELELELVLEGWWVGWGLLCWVMDELVYRGGGVVVAKMWWVGWGSQVVGGWGQVCWMVGKLGQGAVGGWVVGA